MTDTIEEVAKRLAKHNEWRRGGNGEQTNPTQLGRDLDYAVKALHVLQKIASGEDWLDIKSAPKGATLKNPSNEVWILATDGRKVKTTRWCVEYPCSKGVWMINYEPTDYIDNIKHWKPTKWKPLDGATHIKMLLEELNNGASRFNQRR